MLTGLDQIDDVYIGRQPILDRDSNIVAYEILYRNKKTFNYCESKLDDFEITTKVLSIALNNIGADKLTDRKKGLINVNESILNHDLIKNIPKEKFYLEILETTKISDSLIQRIDELIKEGYSFVLDDFTFSKENLEKYKILFPRIKYIKADVKENSMENMEMIIKSLKKLGIKFLAEKVETVEEYEQLKNMGYTFFQGYFFSKPIILSTKKIDPSKIEILNILGMIYNNSDLHMIIKRFEKYPMISLNLLNFLNSAYFSFRKNISSIRQAITLLGMNKLKNWLILLLYTNDGSDPYSNPLFVMIKNRSNFMLKILHYLKKDDDYNSEVVYLTGLLSKIDLVLNNTLENALNDLHIDKVIKDAILEKKGLAGEILSLAEANEENNFEEINQFLEKFSLSFKHLTNANLSTYASNIA